jgi:hypothetical protein
METPLIQSNEALSAMEAIESRRSVRSYVTQSLDRLTVTKLLSAAVRAPTAVHREPWEFVVVQDQDTLKRLSDKAKPLFAQEAQRTHLDRGGHGLDIFASPDFNIFYNAGTLIVICGPSAAPLYDRRIRIARCRSSYACWSPAPQHAWRVCRRAFSDTDTRKVDPLETRKPDRNRAGRGCESCGRRSRRRGILLPMARFDPPKPFAMPCLFGCQEG